MSDEWVERIARALEGIEASEPCAAWCVEDQKEDVWECACDRPERVRARQAAAVLEALELGIANAGGVSIVTGREVAIEALERLAGSPRPQEERP